MVRCQNCNTNFRAGYMLRYHQITCKTHDKSEDILNLIRFVKNTMKMLKL